MAARRVLKPAGSEPWYVYIVRCADGTLYTGSTKDVQKRIATHNSGRGAKYTRPRLPVQLVYFEIQPGRGAALRREYEIKQASRTVKQSLVDEFSSKN